jgi:2-dehydropantoate 2-reductase
MHGTLLDTASPWAASMMRDLDHQAPRLEADHIVGDLIRRAQRVGVDVPLMRAAYAHLQVYEARPHQAQGSVRPLQEAAGTVRPPAVDHASASA